MRTRILCTLGALIGSLLVVASVAGASEPVRQYTLAAGPAAIESPGTLTVLLPAGWGVRTSRTTLLADAADPAHRSHGWPWIRVHWWVTTSLEKPGTTLDAIRERDSLRGPLNRDGKGGKVHQVGDTFLKLPVGTVWRQSLQIVQPKTEGGWEARSYLRVYTLDRGIVREARTGAEKRLFLAFRVACPHDQCAAHNAQLGAIMRSIRLVP